MPELYENVRSEIRAKLEKARMRGHWFLNHDGKWLTPDEFEAQLVNDLWWKQSERPRILDEYSMQDPTKGIIARMKRIDSASLELQEFVATVLDYYFLQEKDNPKREQLKELYKVLDERGKKMNR